MNRYIYNNNNNINDNNDTYDNNDYSNSNNEPNSLYQKNVGLGSFHLKLGGRDGWLTTALYIN